MRLRRRARQHQREEQTRAWLRGVVRSGLFQDARIEHELREVIALDLPGVDPDVAPGWIAEERAQWHADARDWPSVTDYDRLQAAFVGLERGGLRVLIGCEDHWAAKAALADLPPAAVGLAWSTPMDVWHAVDEPMLEMNIWSRDAENQRAGSPLVEEAVRAFAEAGLEAHFDEGRLEIAARWQRRPGVVSGAT